MTNHRSATVHRACDVAVIGGSAAGLAAALQVSRQRRSVIVIDDGTPRNAPASHMHGYLGYEGHPPEDLLRAGRAEARSFGAEILAARATQVTRDPDGRFRVDLHGGHSVTARRVIIATGLVDELPEVEGLAQQWGRGVIHCPFCHGWEVRDQRLVLLVTHPMGLHQAMLFRHLTDHLTVVLHGAPGVDAGELDALRARGVHIIEGTVARVTEDANSAVIGVELSGGEHINASTIVVGPRFNARAEVVASLGLTATEHPMGVGTFLQTNEVGETTVPGVYAAGNVKDPSQQVLHAAADGSKVAAAICGSLAQEDLHEPQLGPSNEVEWDRRYSTERMWSGNPNGSLVAEVAEMPPGRALDVGAGEGADALWLAERGWNVTASDVSSVALDRIATEAGSRGLVLDYQRADANSLNAIEPAAFDLVIAFYASIPLTPDRRGVHTILNAVAPGGTVLVVNHDPHPMRAGTGHHDHAPMYDVDAYLSCDDFAEVIGDSPDWVIELNDKRARPLGSASAQRHVDDIIFRARRIGS
ncbi:MAG: SAM-dependent methyltransferase [Actinobacteria bacterium HGW-Actinobacteria-4]|nr:MAG: SAM-dependent methyltransferase [Actinobacteria bacterium HGW-Actinobacteria-4]